MQGLIVAVCLALFLLLVVIVARASLVTITVESVSMSPTLRDGDRVLVWRWWPARWLRKGQIVVVWPWLLPGDGSRHPSSWGFTPFIKRVVGLPGEVIRATSSEKLQTVQTWQVPPGHIFVCGDNFAHSTDSRVWGPVPSRSVLGVVIMRLPRKSTAAEGEGRRGGYKHSCF